MGEPTQNNQYNYITLCLHSLFLSIMQKDLLYGNYYEANFSLPLTVVWYIVLNPCVLSVKCSPVYIMSFPNILPFTADDFFKKNFGGHQWFSWDH